MFFIQHIMISNKRSLFSGDLQNTSKLFKALSHPARLAILEYLAETRTCITGDIADELPLSRTTVNQHLKELRDAGLIKGTVEGVKKNYCLNIKGIELLEREVNAFFKKIDLKDTLC
jgi:ArsR family transcriptional regulator, arsenate/arsenite/antimonite-responsive transcriptional repressor